MHEADDTTRTKSAVGKWSGNDPNDLTLEDKLEDLRPGDYAGLRVYVNQEFRRAEGRFPISAGDWDDLEAKTVGDVRDEVKRRKR
jgi:hypothetical protein